VIGDLSIEQLSKPVQIMDEKIGELSPIARIHFPKEDIFSENESDHVLLVKA
jgi:hypothetical protein